MWVHSQTTALRTSFLLLLVAGLMIGTIPAMANSADLYHFPTPAQQEQFEKITRELRCLVCQNENLADSTSGLAKDLRQQIYIQITHGANEAAIKQYMVNRYGQFILFKPTFNSSTFLLWSFPFFVLVGGFLIWGMMMRKYNKGNENVVANDRHKTY